MRCQIKPKALTTVYRPAEQRPKVLDSLQLQLRCGIGVERVAGREVTIVCEVVTRRDQDAKRRRHQLAANIRQHIASWTTGIVRVFAPQLDSERLGILCNEVPHWELVE